ncbi:lactoylglutathione lyase [Clostridia bacterium]|nr:lactoylglutathione lyase [Clostridia bacterium]
MDHFPTRQIVKIGIVVDNLEKAVEYYTELFGLEKPKPHPPAPKAADGNKPYTVFRGQDGSAGCKAAVINLEPIYLELIEAMDGPSPWTEFKEKHGQGVQYIAFEANEGFDKVEKLMADRGMPIYHKTEKGKQRYGYFDTYEKLGITLEFKEIDKE